MKRFFLILIIAVLVSWITSTFAQDETPIPAFSETPTYTDTPTPLPSATLTETFASTPELPTLTDTPVPTLEPTSTAIPTEPDLTSTATEFLPSATPGVIVLPSQVVATAEPVLMTDTATIPPLVLPTDTVTSSPTPVELSIPTVVWIPVHADSFDDPNTTSWFFTDPGWSYTAESDGRSVLQVFNSNELAVYGNGSFADVALEIRVDVSAGNAHLYARSNGALTYEVRITSSGNISLLRAGVILAQMQLPDFAAAMPHQLQLNVYGNQVWVALDGQTHLSVNDPEPLPPGTIGLSASFAASAADFTPMPPQYTVRFDDFVVYRPVDQVTATPVFSATPLPSETPMDVPSVTPSLPPMQRPTLAETPERAFTAAEPIEIPDNDVAALIAAMSAGGTMILNLAEGGEYVLYDGPYNLSAPTGLPIIQSGSDITINGHGATIRAGTSGFRVFGVDQGSLTLNDLVLRNASLYTSGGAAVFNTDGIVTLNNVTLEANSAEGDPVLGHGMGGAISTYRGQISVTNSIFRGNYASRYGGAIYNWDGIVHVLDTSFEDNEAGYFGGAIGSRDESSTGSLHGEGNFYIGNHAELGGGVFYMESGILNELRAYFEFNSAGEEGGSVLLSAASGDPVSGSPPTVQVTNSDVLENDPSIIVSAIGGSSVFDFTGNWWGNLNGPIPEALVGSNINASNWRRSPVQCLITPEDSDGDCLPSAFELTIPGLLPTNPDSDENGTRDTDEDYDGDGLSNFAEYFLGTDPTNPVANVNSVVALRDALTAANTLPCAPLPVTIDLPLNSLYTLNDSIDGENGFPVIRCPVIINGYSAVIERSSDAETPQFRFFTVDGGDLTLNDLTLQNGNSFGSGGAVQVGGGALTTREVIFQNNRIEAESGLALRGAAISGFDAVITIEDSSFIDNFNDGIAASEAANGGAIGLDSSRGVNRITRSLFRNNRVTDAGGAIFIGWSSIEIEDSIFEQNTAGRSGGVIHGYSAGISLTGSRLINNSAPRGSAILANYISMQDSCVTGNHGLSVITHFFDPGSVIISETWWGQPDGASGVGEGGGDSIGPNVYLLSHLESPPPGCEITPPAIDSDDDWLADADEGVLYGTDPLLADTDADGLNDGEEIYRWLDALNPDIDDDGLLDGFEINHSETDPFIVDSDGNGIADGDEDSDADGLTNWQEQYISTDPLSVDSDENGIADGAEDFDEDLLTNLEEFLLGTDPLSVDSDDDGLPDGYEVNVTQTNPLLVDTDANGIPDGDEDDDDDGLSNREEFAYETDPFNLDSDSDRLPDGFEVNLLQTDPMRTDTDDNGVTDDREDPDGDGLNNYQESRLGTDPLVFTTLGAPSRLRSETVLMPARATADGSDQITVVTIVRDAQGRFLPNRPVTWTTTNPNFALAASNGVTDEEGVAVVQVTSGAVSSGVVEIHAAEFVVGRPLLQFIGGDPAVRFTATSSTGVLPAQVANAVFEVTNDGVLPIANVEVVANLPFGLGVIESVTTEADVELRGQGNNSAVWNISALGVGERRVFSVRFRVGSTLGLNTQIPLTVQTSSIEDTNAANNSASFAPRIVPGFDFPSIDQQSEKLSISFTSNVTEAAVGQTVELIVLVENVSSEPLFNLSGFAPWFGSTYPNVVFAWADPASPGYLAPAGNGAASQAIARISFTLPAGFPSGLNRMIAVQAIDADPSDGSSIVVRDSLTDGELSVRGPNLQAQLTSNRSSAGVGDEVTFTLTLTNSALATDTATNLQVASNLMGGTASLDPLPPGTSKIFQFTHTVSPADVPQLTAQVLLTGQGLNQSDVSINYSLRRTISVIGTNIAPDTANLVFQGVPTLAFLPGRTTPLPLTAQNMGMMSADNVQLRVNVPYGVDVDVTSLAGGVFDSSKRIITWNVGTLAPNETQSVTPAFITPNDASLGSELIFDVVLSTTSDEITLDDNLISPAGTIALPAPTNVTVAAPSRNWLIADNRDRIALEIIVFDQLDAPLPGAEAMLTASLPGLVFDPATLISDADGRAITEVQATEVGTVNVVATFSNGAIGSTALHRRDSAVSMIDSPDSVGIGGQDRYTLFVVNTATLPDGTTSTGDLVDLTFTLPPELPAEWFQFAQPTLPLGFGDFTETYFTVTLPPASALPDCQLLVGTYPFTVTAAGRTLGVIGEAQGQLTIVAEPPELTNVVPGNGGRVGGDRVLFSWRSNTPGDSTVYYRRQGEPNYTPLPLTADTLDARLYSAVLDITGDPEGTIYQWYGETSNGCSTRSIGTAAQPQTFTRVRSTTFVDSDYDFTITDDYDVTTTTAHEPLAVRIRNDDDVSHAILVDVENPYPDLTLGFIGSGSVDQVMTLAPGQIFSTQLRVFPQDTEREFYTLTLRLENDIGDVDRVPLVIRVQQPHVELDIQVLEIDPRTLVTRARLTNLGDTLTDLTLDIVQDSTGIPANFVIQPDIQHTYLRAGQSLEISFIPLDLQDSASGAFSEPTFDPLTGTSLDSTPSLMVIDSPYRVTANARNTTISNVTLRDGTLTNICGADGSDRTIAADCTTPAGTETRVVNGWYCTNRPNFDVPVSLALPNGGLGVPITNVSVGANFSPGGGAYTHSTTVSLNGSLVGSAIVPSQSRITGSIAPETLILGGSSPTQILRLRSTHTNGTHYTVASGFTVTVEYDEHTRTGCFTQAEIDAAAGGGLMCSGETLPAFATTPDLELDLALGEEVDPTNLRVGDRIPVVARITNVGSVDTTNPVILTLNVPEGLAPAQVTAGGESQPILDIVHSLLDFLANLLGGQTLTLERSEDAVTVGYTYTLQPLRGFTAETFAFELEVLAEFAGTFTITGTASTELALPEVINQSFLQVSALSGNVSEAQASVVLQISNPNVIQVDAAFIGGSFSDGNCTLSESIVIANNAGQRTEDQTDCRPIREDTTIGDAYLIEIIPEQISLVEPYEGDNGLPTVTSSIILRGSDGAIHTIARDSSATALFRVLQIAAEGNVTLDGINVVNGNVEGDGGGIHNAGTLTLQNNGIVQSNAATGNGGGIYNLGTLSIQNSTIRDNRSGSTGLAGNNYEITASVGGGVYNGGSLTVLGTNIYMNRTDDYGGGIYNVGTLSIDASRIERNVVANTAVDSRHLDYTGQTQPPTRLDGAGGGVYHSGSGTASITNSCVNLNTARNGGGIFATDGSSLQAPQNWWGHINGPTRNNVGATQGDRGDVITGAVIVNTDDWLSTAPSLNLPLLVGVQTQECYELTSPFITTGQDGTFGRPDLALEVYIRASDLIGREVELAEVMATGIYVASNQGEGFSENELHMFAEAIGRIYHEYNQENRGEAAPACYPQFRPQQLEYLSLDAYGLLCTLGTLSEWYGEINSAEYQSLFVVDAIRLGILPMNTSPTGGVSWLDRGRWVEDNPEQRMLGRPDKPDCLNWESGLNRAEDSDNYNPDVEVQGCPWIWGNQSKLYDNLYAQARLANTDLVIDGQIIMSPRNNSMTQANPGPSYLPGYPSSEYETHPDSNIQFTAISLRTNQANPFYLFTIIQNNVLKCDSPLAAVPDDTYEAGYYPSCF